MGAPGRVHVLAVAVASALLAGPPIAGSEAPALHWAAPGAPSPASAFRSGPVRLEGRAFADDGGVWNPLGATLFWALWGERHDPDRLDRNLRYLAGHGVDFVRILAMVGSESWRDRQTDPRWPDYWTVVDGLFTRLGRHGLRAEVTLLADAHHVMPREAERVAFVERWAARLNRHGAQVMFAEVANEAWQNGVDVNQLRRFGDALRSATPIPIALTAPREHEVLEVYGGWPGIATMHYDRDTGTADGAWRPVWQPWRWPVDYVPRASADTSLPPVVVNNEPIGPQSSVAGEQDPLRIAMAFATTFVAGNAAYVYHTGAGIRGGGRADAALKRYANVDEYDPAILDAVARVRRHLPPGLARWRHADRSPAPTSWIGTAQAVARGDITGAHFVTDADRLVGVVLGVRRAHVLTARRDLDLTFVHPLTGARFRQVSAAAGETWTMPAAPSGYVVVGALR